MAKHVTLDQIQNIVDGIAVKNDARFLKKTDAVATVGTYQIKKQVEAEQGYAETYQLFKTTGAGLEEVETAVGAKINIPKDVSVESGTIETVSVADTPYVGASVGDKYIDLTLDSVDNTHVYVPIGDLGQININSLNSNGLSLDENGISLATATAYTSGAMSATDKAKLDGFEDATDDEIQALINGIYAD